MLPRKRSSHYGFGILIASVRLQSAAFYFIKIGLIYRKLCFFKTLGSILSDFSFLSVVRHLKKFFLRYTDNETELN